MQNEERPFWLLHQTSSVKVCNEYCSLLAKEDDLKRDLKQTRARISKVERAYSHLQSIKGLTRWRQEAESGTPEEAPPGKKKKAQSLSDEEKAKREEERERERSCHQKQDQI